MDGYNDNKVRFKKKKFFRILKSQKLIMKTKKKLSRKGGKEKVKKRQKG